MARIPLRAYQNDIEAMIDKNQIDEAFAHCRYILQIYPKNVDTYRLMGKALLEAQRFSDAADVFHRVLSSVPDDFIAHLGMSIIREDEGNLDAALWHMERSFEVQPSNAAVQVELRRLYGLRDGVTPQKIQLTRGALARMSAKSNLYTQSIAELRAALSSDPQRPDLLVVLADMYVKTGARMEAIETCNSLINKLPYCLVANRILSELLPETERADQAGEYKSRLVELDPYYSQISPVAPTIEQVPDGAVTIERFQYSDEAIEESRQAKPDWAASLGVDLEDEVTAPDEPAPAWMEEDIEELQDEDSIPSEHIEAEEEQPITAESEDSEQVPDWMVSAEEDEEQEVSESAAAGLAAGAAAFGAGAVLADQDEEDTDADGDAEPGVMPDLQDEQVEEEIPGWMQAAEEQEQTLDVDQTGEIEPGFEAEQEPAELKETEQEFVSSIESEQPSEEDTPDWLREAMEGSDQVEEDIIERASAAGMGALIPDEESLAADSDEVMSQLTPETGLEAESDEVEQDSPPEPDAAGEAAGLAAAALAGAGIGAVLDEDELSTPEAESGEVDHPEEDFAADSMEGEFESEPEEEIPDWLRDLGEDLPEETPAAGAAVVFTDDSDQEAAAPGWKDEEEEYPAEIMEESPAETVKPEPEPGTEEQLIAGEHPESIPDWLSEVSPEELTVQAGETDEQVQIVRAEIPVWLKKMEEQHRAELAGAPLASEVEDQDLEVDFTDFSGEDVPSWLMSAMDTELPGEIEDEAEIEEAIQKIDEFEAQEEEILSAESISEQLESEELIESPVEEVELEDQAEEPAAEELYAEETAGDVELDAEQAPQVAEEAGTIPEPEAAAAITQEEIEELPAEEEGEVAEEEGVGLAGLAAAGAAAAQLFTDEDTQPIAVTEEPEPGEVEPEQVEEKGEMEPVAGPVDEPLSGEEEEAAMAWLESLAAKQGAAEEELLTPAEERMDEPPEWVSESIEEEAEETAEEVWTEDDSAGIAATALAGSAAREDGEEKEAGQPEEEAAEEELAAEKPSEWVPEEIPEDELAPPAEALVLDKDADRVSEPIEIEEEPEIVEELATAAEIDLEQVEAEESPGEIPGWLSGLAEDQEEAAELETGEWTPEMLAEDAEAPATETEQIGTEKIDLNAASLAQLEKIPGIGFIHAQNILEYRANYGSFSHLDQLENVEGMTTDLVSELEQYLSVEVVSEFAEPAESSMPELQAAWDDINDGNIDQAVEKYTGLISQDQHLDEIIRDLQAALGKYPMDSALYQSLGDAYMHADRLQEALDAYNRAEDLIG